MKILSAISLSICLLYLSSCKLVGTDTGNAVDSDTQADFEAGMDLVNDSAGESLYSVSTKSEGDVTTSLTTALILPSINRGNLFRHSYRSTGRTNPNCPVVDYSASGLNFSILRTFDNCKPFSTDTTFDGSERIDVSQSSNDINSDSLYDRSGSFERNLSILFPHLRREIQIVTNHDFDASGTWPNVTHHFTSISTSRKRYRTTDSKLLRDYEITGELTNVLSGSDDVVEKIVSSGSLEIQRNLAALTLQWDISDLSYEQGCLCPVSGSIVRSIVAGTNEGQVKRFTVKSCGEYEVTTDGIEGTKTLSLDDCEDS